MKTRKSTDWQAVPKEARWAAGEYRCKMVKNLKKLIESGVFD
jgi:hypothetical protein